MKNLQKGFTPLILLIMIVVIAIGGGAYYVSTKNSASQVPVETTQNNSTTTTVNANTTVPNTQTNTTKPAPTTNKPVVKLETKPVTPSSSTTRYADPAGYSFTYDSSKVRVNKITTSCDDPKNLQTCKEPLYQGAVNVASKETNFHGDYFNAKYTANVRFYHSYDTSNVYPPAQRTLFDDNNKESYMNTLVEGFKNSATFLDGRGSGQPVTKVDERTINGQRAVVIYRGGHIEAVVFHTKPYQNGIRFIGVIDEDVDALSELDNSDKLITSIMDSFTDTLQQVYVTKN